MAVCLLWLCLSANPNPNGTGVDAVKPAVLTLFGAESWYRWAREWEPPFEGVRERVSGNELTPPRRSIAYRLSWTDARTPPVPRARYLPATTLLRGANPRNRAGDS